MKSPYPHGVDKLPLWRLACAASGQDSLSTVPNDRTIHELQQLCKFVIVNGGFEWANISPDFPTKHRLDSGVAMVVVAKVADRPNEIMLQDWAELRDRLVLIDVRREDWLRYRDLLNVSATSEGRSRKQLPIADAAQLAGISVNDLLNLAVSGQIYLGAMLAPFTADGCDYAGRKLAHPHWRQLGAKAETCILDHEAKEILLSGSATLKVWREPGFENGVSIPQLGETPVVYFLREPQQIGRSSLWVYEDELPLLPRGALAGMAPVHAKWWKDLDNAAIEEGGETAYSPDKHHQFLQATPNPSDIEMELPVWDVETAAHLITIGRKISSVSDAARLKDWPGLGQGSFMLTISKVITRAITIASESIKAGRIKADDTPSNWVLWAECQGYAVEHLMAISSLAFDQKSEHGQPQAAGESPKARRDALDISRERGARRRIIESWNDIEKEYGPKADAHQVLRVLKRNQGADQPMLKTVQNHLSALRTEGLIP